MSTALLSLATAMLFGTGDFLGGFASRRASALAVTANAHALGVVIFALAVAVFPAPFASEAIIAGVLSGVSGGIGVACLYGALARGRMSIVAPITAAISGSLPAVYDFARGSRLPATSLAALGVALAAIVIVSTSTVEEQEGHPGMPTSALVLALAAGVGFAASFVSFSFAGADSGFWPLLAARITSCAMIAALALMRGTGLRVPAGARRATVSAGLFEAGANVTMLAAIRTGQLAVASVLGSLYPVVTMLLAWLFLRERIRGIQRLGVAFAIAAVVMAAL